MNPETGNVSYDAWLWLTFLLIGLATTLPRASFIVLGNRVVLPSVVQRALRYAPAAALAAIVAPDVLLVAGDFTPLNPKLAAALAAIAAASLSRNPWLPFIAGMALAYFLDPVADRLERLGLSRMWATVVILVTFIVVFVLVIKN